MKKITGIIVARNSEKTIAKALKSLNFCDEVIVIDNGSDDKTELRAKEEGARVFSLSSNDFSELRNFGLEKADSEWVFYLDSDESVSDELAQNIKKTVSKGLDYSAYAVIRKNYYLGNFEWPQKEKILRLFKKKFLEGWTGSLHESPKVKGETSEIEGELIHETHKNLSEMLSKTIEWSKTEAELRFRQNHPKVTWWRIPRMMIYGFIRSYVLEKGYKVGTAGLVESIYQAFSYFVTYARLWELQLEEEKNEN